MFIIYIVAKLRRIAVNCTYVIFCNDLIVLIDTTAIYLYMTLLIQIIYLFSNDSLVKEIAYVIKQMLVFLELGKRAVPNLLPEP